MKRNFDRFERIVAVEREHDAALVAAGLLMERLRSDPSFLQPSLQARDAKALLQNIQATFMIRLFAEFEAGLRDIWKNTLGKTSRPNTEVLMNRIAAIKGIGGTLLAEAHQVRSYRNAFVHEEMDAVATIDLKEARRRLCRFLSRAS